MFALIMSDQNPFPRFIAILYFLYSSQSLVVNKFPNFFELAGNSSPILVMAQSREAHAGQSGHFPKRDRICYEYSAVSVIFTARTHCQFYGRPRCGDPFLHGATHYGSSGKPEELYRMQGLDVGSLVKAVIAEIKK